MRHVMRICFGSRHVWSWFSKLICDASSFSENAPLKSYSRYSYFDIKPRAGPRRIEPALSKIEQTHLRVRGKIFFDNLKLSTSYRSAADVSPTQIRCRQRPRTGNAVHDCKLVWPCRTGS